MFELVLVYKWKTFEDLDSILQRFLNDVCCFFTEAVARKGSVKKVFFKIS